MTKTYENARRFVYQNARPLDFARWKLYFENGPREAVWDALAAYQNQDGGFGYGLEVDCLCPVSTPIQTWQATMTLRETGLFDRNHPIVRGIISYLTSGAAFDGHFWSAVVPEGNDYPHAPWWSYDANAQPTYNPTASLAGFLLRVSEKGDAAYEMGARIAREALEFYSANPIDVEMHLLPCLRTMCADILAAAPEIGGADELLARVEQSIIECVKRDAPLLGKEYGAMALNYIMGPNDPLAAPLAGNAANEAQLLLRTQQPDGAWPLMWQWGMYPEAFAVATNCWQSALIIGNRLALRGMGLA